MKPCQIFPRCLRVELAHAAACKRKLLPVAGILSGISLTDPAELEATDLACDMIASFYSLDRCEAHGTPAEVLTVAKINRVHLVQVILARA